MENTKQLAKNIKAAFKSHCMTTTTAIKNRDDFSVIEIKINRIIVFHFWVPCLPYIHNSLS